jgi:hypothetical protein
MCHLAIHVAGYSVAAIPTMVALLVVVGFDCQSRIDSGLGNTAEQSNIDQQLGVLVPACVCGNEELLQANDPSAVVGRVHTWSTNGTLSRSDAQEACWLHLGRDCACMLVMVVVQL